MDSLKALDKKTRIFQQNILLKFAIVCFGLSAFFSSLFAYQTRNATRTIVAPSHFSSSFTVTNSWMDDRGLNQYTWDVIDLLLNYTPKTAARNFSHFEKMVLPVDYSATHGKLQDELATIKRLMIVSSFIPEETIIDRERQSITVNGLRRKESHGREIVDEPERWMIYYRVKNANFYVTKWKKVER